MKTAEAIIKAIEKLPPDEQQKVEHYFDDMKLSPEVVEDVLRRAKDAEMGINMTPVFDNAKDAIEYLKKETATS